MKGVLPGMAMDRAMNSAFSRIGQSMEYTEPGNIHFYGGGPTTDISYSQRRVTAIKGAELAVNGRKVASEKTAVEALHQLLGPPQQRAKSAEIFEFTECVLYVQVSPIEFCWGR